MQTLSASKLIMLFLVAVFGAACGGSTAGTTHPPTTAKGQIDLESMATSATVERDAELAMIPVYFSRPIPRADDAALQEEMQAAVEVIVTNPLTEVSVSLADGTTLVAELPANPGELSWQLDDDRYVATLVFFNRTAAGQTLVPGQSYTVALTVIANPYIEEVPTTTFSVLVE